VQSSLRKEVGDILVGESGSRLKNRFAELYGRFFTPKTGVPTGELSAARKDVSRLETLLKDKRSELSQLDHEVAALETALARRDKLTDPAMRERLEKAKAEALLEARNVGGSGSTADSRRTMICVSSVRSLRMRKEPGSSASPWKMKCLDWNSD
jgi:uncharacterized protein YlxW (UPF0749 family)